VIRLRFLKRKRKQRGRGNVRDVGNEDVWFVTFFLFGCTISAPVTVIIMYREWRIALCCMLARMVLIDPETKYVSNGNLNCDSAFIL